MSTYLAEEVELDNLPEDQFPDNIAAPEYTCETCGRELTYGGRGRKPRFCDEHKPGNKHSTNPKRAASARNVQLAAQAADVLMLSNGFVQMVASISGLENTAEAIERANPEFRQRAYEALLTDPELARSITKGGAVTGKVALVMAYGMFAVSVAPTAMMEYKLNRAEKLRLVESELE